jgi:hypothetical protein
MNFDSKNQSVSAADRAFSGSAQQLPQIERRRSASLLRRRAQQAHQPLARLAARRTHAVGMGGRALQQQTRGVSGSSGQKSSRQSRVAKGPLTIFLSPEVLKSIRRKFCVTHRVLDIPMTEPSLQRPGVVAGVGQGIAAGVPEHVREDREGHSSALPEASKQRPEALGRHRAAALGHEDVWRRLLLAL